MTLDFDDALEWSFFVSPAETKDALRRLARGADALAADFIASPGVSEATREAFKRWWADAQVFVAANLDKPFWAYSASLQDAVERNLAELGQWRERFAVEARRVPTAPEPLPPTLPEQGRPGGFSDVTPALKWGAALVGIAFAFKLYQDFR